MSAYKRGTQVRVTHGAYQGVMGFVEALQGAEVLIKVSVIPPHLERREISDCVSVRITDCRVIT